MIPVPPKGKQRPRRLTTQKSLTDLETLKIDTSPLDVIETNSVRITKTKKKKKKKVKKLDEGDDDENRIDNDDVVQQNVPNSDQQTSRRFDALPTLTKGSTLLKFGRLGKPDYRMFMISEGNTVIQWFSKKKPVHECRIPLSAVNRLEQGQTTPQFRRFEETKQFEDLSFSIIYNNETASLSVVAKDPAEYVMWTHGLRQLLEEVKLNHPVHKLKALLVSMSDEHANYVQQLMEWTVTMSPAHSPTTGVQLASPVGARTPSSRSSAHSKHLEMDVWKAQKRVQSRFDRTKNLLSSKRGKIVSKFEDPITRKYAQIADEITALHNDITDGEYVNAQRLAWRLKIDVAALETMIHACLR